MSFILESLQRAQRDRRAGKAPDLEQAYHEPPFQPQRRRRWPWAAAAAALVVVVAAAGFAVWRSYPEPETSSSASHAKKAAATRNAPAPKDPSAVRVSKGGATPPTAASRPLPPKPRGVQKTTSHASPLAKEARLPRPPAPQPADEPMAPELADAIDVRPPAPVADDAMLPGIGTVDDEQPAEAPDDVDEPTDDNPPELMPPEPVEAQPPSASDGGASRPPAALDLSKIPLAADLPPEIRDKLAKLTINVHGYFENPDRRVVYINMQRYRVGDTIAPDNFLLEAITPEGVVINYGQGRARLLVRR